MQPDRAPRWRSPRWRRVVTTAFVSVVAILIFRQAREVDWVAVAASLRAYRWPTIAQAAALTAASYSIYASYDWIGRRLTRNGLSVRQVAGVAFVSYAFNLNFGSLVGGVALRYRLYSRLGLRASVITQVLGYSVVTNWLGYAALAGLVLTLHPLEVPTSWPLGSETLRALGVVLLVAVAAYLAACFALRRRHWRIRAVTLVLPDGPTAVLQLLLSCLNWLVIAAIVFVLLQRRIDFPDVLAAMLAAAVAGVITHVPAGLGVLEAVFIALLAHRAPASDMLAALLAYRAIYYLAPLVPALAHYFIVGERGPVGASAAAGPASRAGRVRPISTGSTGTVRSRPSPPLGP